MPALRPLRVDVVRVLRSIEEASTKLTRPRVWMERLEPRVLLDGAGADAFKLWVHDVSPDYDDGSAIAVGADGAIYAGGAMWDMRGFVTRYLPDGTLDTSFGTNGVADIDSGEPDDRVLALAVQADGKVVLTGWSRTFDEVANRYDNHFFRMHLNADGSPDRAYANGGTNGEGVVMGVPGNNNIGARLFAQANGDVLMVTTASRADSDLLLARFDANGMPVQSFGDGGYAWIDLGGDERLLHTSITADGKVMLTGQSSLYPAGEHRALLARVLSNGSLDPSFADGGVTLANVQFLGETGYIDVATDAAGRTFTLGRSEVWCFAPDGTPDPSFGDGGVLRFADTNHTPFSLLVTKSGGVVVGGVQYVPELGMSDGTIWYGFTPDGAPDPAFGDGGSVRLESGRAGFYFEHVFAPDGAVFHIGAKSMPAEFGSQYAFAYLRIDPQLTGGFLHWNDVPGGSEPAPAPQPKPQPEPTDPDHGEVPPAFPTPPHFPFAPEGEQPAFGFGSVSSGGIMDLLDPDDKDRTEVEIA